jgi:hypothetical protein
MHVAQFLVESTDSSEAGAGVWLVWIGFAVVVGLLWMMIQNTKQRAVRDHQNRRRREQEERDNDPDLARPEEEA